MNNNSEITPKVKNIGPYPYFKLMTGNITIVTEHISQLVNDENWGCLPGDIYGTYIHTAGIKVPPWIVM